MKFIKCTSMEWDIIKFENGRMFATGSNVLMTSTELGELFEVSPAQVDRAVQRLIKRGIFDNMQFIRLSRWKDTKIKSAGRERCTA